MVGRNNVDTCANKDAQCTEREFNVLRTEISAYRLEKVDLLCGGFTLL